MIEISNITKKIKHSEIRKMYNKALEYDNVISFTLGEPDFTASKNVVEAGCEAIKIGQTKYSENAGVFPLRTAISEYLKKTIDVYYNPVDEIVATPGAMGALYLCLKAILNPGDEVIVNMPCWTNYIQQIVMCEGKPVAVRTKKEDGFNLDIDKIAEVVTTKTKAIIINSPCNPTGGIVSVEDLEQLAELAMEKDLLVISDEVYKHILFDDQNYTSISSFDGMKQRTVIIDSLSKTYAMTGWRIGYAASTKVIINSITKLQENVSACVTMPSQYAAIEALSGPQEHLEYMVSQYKERRDYMLKRIEEIPNISCQKPKGTFYAFISIKDTGLTSEEFAMNLLDKNQVVVVPGTAFGQFGEGYIRMSYATSMKNIKEGLNRIEDFVMNECCV